MKTYCFALLLISTLLKGQNFCLQTSTPNQIYYPNTSSSNTVANITQYLCGPNTILWDTAQINSYFIVYVSSGSTLNFGTLPNTQSSFIYLKANSTLNILKNYSGGNISFEQGAVINNPYGASTFTTLCSSITFPVVDCVSNGVGEHSINTLHLYPNPASAYVDLKSDAFAGKKLKLRIEDISGREVDALEIETIDQVRLSTESYTGGIYFVTLVNGNSLIARHKLIIQK